METQEEFSESKALIEEVDFYETHIFKYSRRKGTRADRMEGQVPEEIKTRRSHELIELGEEHKRKYMETFLGKEVEILFGHTREYMKALVKREGNLENRILKAKVTGLREGGLLNCTI